MSDSRHVGGSDVLTSVADLYVALGVRLRERPGAHWRVEMHPQTRAMFDIVLFHQRVGTHHVHVNENSRVRRGEFHLMQHGFGASAP